MTDEPTVDGRRREDLYREATEIAPSYTEEWTPGSDGAGTALVHLYAELAAEVVERLDRVPQKHRVSFFDTLGFTRDPPQPARAPVAFQIADGVSGNVAVPAGTEAIAPAAGDRPEQTFRVAATDAFEATPANLVAAYSVDPEADAIFEHWTSLSAGDETTLFEGVDRQAHALYVGHADRLAVTPSEDEAGAGSEESPPGATIQVALATEAPAALLRDSLVWEYYGERDVDGETVEGWHPFEGAAGRWPVVLPGTTPGGQVVGTEDRVATEQVIESTIRFLEEQGYQLAAADARAIEQAITNQASFRGESTPLTATRSDGGRTGYRRDDASRATAKAARLTAEHVQFEQSDVASIGDVESGSENRSSGRTLSLRLTGTPTETAVNGTKSRWIRARIPDWYADGDLFDLVFETSERTSTQAPIRVGPEPHEATMPPDTLLANDVELSARTDAADSTIRPFGATPRPQDAFYVASEEMFTKAGSRVEIVFEPPADLELIRRKVERVKTETRRRVYTDGEGEGEDENGGDGEIEPDVRWEYWDGSAWSRLEIVADTTAELTKPVPGGETRSVEFRVPDDLAETSVAGHDGHWVRARLVGGRYGRVVARRRSETEWVSDHEVTPPEFGSVALRYREEDLSAPAAHVVTENNLAFSGNLADRNRVVPFDRVPDTEQTVYLGFDGVLDDGPINLFASLADTQYPAGFHSRIRWEFRDGSSWRRLSVSDGTEGLTERGIVSLTFPTATVEADRFGRRTHWVRARVTGTAFGDDESATTAVTDTETETGTGTETAAGACGVDPCGTAVETEPPAGRPENVRPTVEAIAHNATWFRNVRTVPAETLGSSNGDRTQTFRVASPPVVEIEVWVDEHRMLSEGEREALREARPDRIRTETGPEGDRQSFWVRWKRVDDFLGSDADDRHYVLTQATGELTFGDGERGRIPPRGTDNVEASYETGGGDAGNVDANAISELKSGIPNVDAVTNPVAADGGADVESTAEVLDRAPKELRDRDRAVTEGDFERLAADASRRIARTRCLSGMNRAGEHESGWVTVLIVPDSSRDQPDPSVTLKEQVHAHVRDRAPATLVGAPDQLVIRGPSYVGVSVEADLVTTGVGSISALEETAERAVSSYLHPLTGGDDGTGWAFGDGPCLSDVYALLERIDGVDHVVDIELRFHGSGDTVTVREGDEEPSMSADALVHSATHEITARVEGTDSGADGTGGDA